MILLINTNQVDMLKEKKVLVEVLVANGQRGERRKTICLI